MSEAISSYSVRGLLTDTTRYLIPMYQRNYAWGEGEIKQLIQDVRDMLDKQQKQHNSDNKSHYYIGTLIVFKRSDGSFEVIDGQQRFTTLTLMAICLRRLMNYPSHCLDMSWYDKPNLDFESRKKSSDTFEKLSQGLAPEKLDKSEYNCDVITGFVLIEKELLLLGNQLTDFCDYLFNYVQIARVPVPDKTDLNH
ncbi:DUF262 domain-containing protein [Ectothiorhodospiraceae bacterium BW-2]|nr:DUF262 domain-containing protein [Ectothiorhodospiraceae bacterium BW-2]